MKRIFNNSTRLSSEEFISTCKRLVRDECSKRCYGCYDNIPVTANEVFVVWYCKTLQNHKALLSVTGSCTEYFECAYDGDRNRIYLDTYTKVNNQVCELIKSE